MSRSYTRSAFFYSLQLYNVNLPGLSIAIRRNDELVFAQGFGFADAEKRVPVTDVTEFNVGGEKLYLSPILDLFNSEIIAFETARRPVYKMIDTMLNAAFKRLSPMDKPILHFHQGWQYRMHAYQASRNHKALHKACHAKEIASIMPRWRVSLLC